MKTNQSRNLYCSWIWRINRQSVLPAPTGTTTFQLLLISFDIRRLIPLSLLPLRFPWSGCWHFIDALNLTPNWSRCFGQIVKSRPSSSNNPTRPRISSFSEETLVCDTDICRRWALKSLEQELRGRSSFSRDEISQWESQCEEKEQERLDIVSTTQRSRRKWLCCAKDSQIPTNLFTQFKCKHNYLGHETLQSMFCWGFYIIR